MNRSGIITIVDLCGSERVKKSEVHGERLKEAININASLSALKSVLTALGHNHAVLNLSLLAVLAQKYEY